MEKAFMDSEAAPEATSLLGKPLYRMELSADAEAITWLGRRLAYMWRYRHAVDTFSKGIELHSESFKLYLHRGHRQVTLRAFDLAIADLERATALIEGVDDEVDVIGRRNCDALAEKVPHLAPETIGNKVGVAYENQIDWLS